LQVGFAALGLVPLESAGSFVSRHEARYERRVPSSSIGKACSPRIAARLDLLGRAGEAQRWRKCCGRAERAKWCDRH